MDRSAIPELRLKLRDFRENATFELIFEASPVTMIIVDVDGRISLVNSAAEECFGYSRDELVGRPVELLVPARFQEQHPQMRRSYFKDAHVRKMGAGLELSAVRKDGSEFPVDVSLHPIRVNGEMAVLTHLVDATDRKAAEEQAASHEVLERMRFMVEHLPAGAIYVSPRRLIMNKAAERITGYSRDEITTLSAWFDRLYGRDAEKARRQYESDLRSDFCESRVVELTRKDGVTRQVQFAGYRYDDHEVWLFNDMTELREAQDRLVQSERLAAIGQMMAALAHESRNAIQRAQACLEMLELDIADRPELLDLNARTRRALDELNRLYEEVRGYAAPVQLDCQPCDLCALCRDVWAQIVETHTDKQIVFQIDANGGDCVCNVDKPRISQVVRNILENAYAACGERGEIRVCCEETTLGEVPALRISFSDDGHGLTDEHSQRLFEPFFTTKSKGTGLGMAIAKRIVDAHHGDIRVGRSDAPGAEIRVALPRSG
ncbi:MAG: PAS domain S-box protein [Planctomycetaceae bacterium]